MARFGGIIEISTNFKSTIPFKIRNENGLPTKRDFIFIPKKNNQLGDDGGIIFHIVDSHTAIILIINTNTENVYLFKNNKLNIFQNYKKKCYLTNAENVFLTINSGNHQPAEINWLRKTVKSGMIILAAYQAIVNFLAFLKFVILIGITIYGDNPAIRIQFAEVTEIYPRLWENYGSTVTDFYGEDGSRLH